MSQCLRPLHGEVAYCPYCGSASANGAANPAVSEAGGTVSQFAEVQPQAAPAVTAIPPAQAGPVAPAAAVEKGPVVAAPVAAASEAGKADRAGKAPASPPEPASVRTSSSGNKKWLVPGAVALVLGYLVFGRSHEVTAPAPMPTPVENRQSSRGAVTPALPKPVAAAAEPAQAASRMTIDDVVAAIPVAAAKPLLMTMLVGARDADSASVQNARRELLQVVPPPRGDRKHARSANTAGLDAFRRNEFSAATQLFSDAVLADPADQEVVNNLAFALHKEGRLPEARTAVLAALALAPERATAWSNFAEILADSGEAEQAVSAFILTFRYSGNAVKTREYLQDLADNALSVPVRTAATKALSMQAMSLTGPSDPAAGAAAVAAAVAAANAAAATAVVPSTPPPARVPVPAVVQVPAAAASAPQNARPAPVGDNSGVIAGMLDEVESCLATMKYDCAIAGAKAALRFDPESRRARSLLRRAEAEQKRAMDSITIN